MFLIADNSMAPYGVLCLLVGIGVWYFLLTIQHYPKDRSNQPQDPKVRKELDRLFYNQELENRARAHAKAMRELENK